MRDGWSEWTDRFLGLSFERLDLGLELLDGVAVLVVSTATLFELSQQLADALLVLAHVLVGLRRSTLLRVDDALQLVDARLQLLNHLLAALGRGRLGLVETRLHLLQLVTHVGF